ncbi:hypothetical protein H8E88_07255 [candidate division KSB1 bacterium]|nr:hypothetical protein [candidate division KSB1 bacterium]MBL7093905.1 hypothetical protein [candidate division KSB1 bacterium]
METLLDTHFLIILLFGILIIIGAPIFMLVRLLHKIYNRFEQIENELKRFNETRNIK